MFYRHNTHWAIVSSKIIENKSNKIRILSLDFDEWIDDEWIDVCSKQIYGPVANKVIRNMKHQDWQIISMCETLDEKFIRQFDHKLDWHLMSQHQTLSEAICNEYFSEIRWFNAVNHQKLSISSLIKFNKYHTQRNNLDFWRRISSHQNLSKESIEKFEHLLDMEKILSNKNMVNVIGLKITEHHDALCMCFPADLVGIIKQYICKSYKDNVSIQLSFDEYKSFIARHN